MEDLTDEKVMEYLNIELKNLIQKGQDQSAIIKRYEEIIAEAPEEDQARSFMTLLDGMKASFEKNKEKVKLLIEDKVKLETLIEKGIKIKW